MTRDAQYQQIVTSIKKLQRRNVETFFEIGQQLNAALALGFVSQRQLAGDLDMPRSAMQNYLYAWRYWKDDRIPGDPGFVYYVRAARLNDPALRRGLVKRGIEPYRHRLVKATHESRSIRTYVEKLSTLIDGRTTLPFNEANALVTQLDQLRSQVLAKISRPA